MQICYASSQDIEIYKKQALRAEIDNNLCEAERLLIRLWEICPGDPEIRQDYKRVIVKQDRQAESKASNPPSVVNTNGVKSREKVEKEEAEPLSENSTETKQSQQLFQFEVITVNQSGQEIKREQGQAEYFREELGNNITLDMVNIPEEKFLMGTKEKEINRLNEKFDTSYFNQEKPQDEVKVKAFYMGKYLVTQAQWQAVMGNDPAKFQDSLQNPVEKVSWDDDKEFCEEKISAKSGKKYRLPSEAEWEYACSAETATPFHFGATIHRVSEL